MELCPTLNYVKPKKTNMIIDLLTDIVKIDDILLIVRTGGAITEMRSNSLNLRQKDNWITIGDNDGHVTCMWIQTKQQRLSL